MIVLTELAVTPDISYGIAADSYNLILARRKGNNWTGWKFFPKFVHMQPLFKQLGLDLDNVRALIQQSLFHVYKLSQDNKRLMTLVELDKRFQPWKQRKTTTKGGDSSGITQLYMDLRSFVKGAVGPVGDDDEEEGGGKSNAFIEVPEFAGKAIPQASFNEVEEEPEEESEDGTPAPVSKRQSPPAKSKPKFGSLLSSIRAAATATATEDEEDIVVPMKKKKGK